MNRRQMMATGLALALSAAAPLAASARPLRAGAVYTMSNAADGNTVVAFDRDWRGRLTAAGEFATGGLGTGGGLGNQGGIALSGNDRWLLVVNAGSNDVSIFEVRPRALVLTDRVSSFGTQPISITESRGIVYVLNAGSLNVAGYRIWGRGRLRAIPGSVQPVGGSGSAPAQIGLSPDGDTLAVTLKDSNEIVTYAVDRFGAAGLPIVTASNGPTPFGFDFGKRDQLFVTEAAGGAPGASSLSSYEVRGNSSLETITAAAATHQTAACWVSVSPNGRFAYTANTPAATLSGFSIDEGGMVSLLDPSGVSATTGDGSAPVDMAFARSGRFLYVLNSGTHTIGAFRVRGDGSLVPMPAGPSIPDAANGIAAR